MGSPFNGGHGFPFPWWHGFPYVANASKLVEHDCPCVFHLFAMMVPSPLVSNWVRWGVASHLSAYPPLFNVLVLPCFAYGLARLCIVFSIVLTWFFMICLLRWLVVIALSMELLDCCMVLSMGWRWFSLLGLWGRLIFSIVHQYILVRASGPHRF